MTAKNVQSPMWRCREKHTTAHSGALVSSNVYPEMHWRETKGDFLF